MKTRAQLDRELAQADAKLPAVRAQLMRIPGVVRVNAGMKVTSDQATEQVAFLVYVTRKIPAHELSDAQRIPSVVEGIPTDVLQLPVAHREADVLWGGSSVTTGLWGLGGGTLGAIGITAAGNTVAAAGTPILLTNHHVAENIGSNLGHGCMCNCWCCDCGVIGTVIDTRKTPTLDASIATLNADVPWSRAIAGLGAVTGIAPANRGDVVFKYGQTTGLTKGRIVDDNLTLPPKDADDMAYNGQLFISPEAPTTDMSLPGDSGSVYVNAETRKVVGLHHSAPGAPQDKSAIACHMTKVGGGGVADELKIDFPNMGTAGATPIGGAPEPQMRPGLLKAVLALRRDLECTESGQRWLDLLNQHAPEVRHLVNHHRATQVAWQRSQGPAFIAHFLKSARDATHRVPLEIGGMRAENAVLTMAAVLQEHASAELARAVSEHYLVALQCMQRVESTENLLRNATRLAGVHRGK